MTGDKHVGSLIDWARSARLGDVGAAGYAAAVCVTTSGEDVLWLVSKVDWFSDHPRHGDASQPHEQLGPLPRRWRERVAWAAPFRCGRPTKSGRPCRLPVDQAGGACSFHRAARPDAERHTAS